MDGKIFAQFSGMIRLATGLIFLCTPLSLVTAQKPVTILDYAVTEKQPGYYGAEHTSESGGNLRAKHLVSMDNGHSWASKSTTVKALEKIKIYSRRVAVSSIFDKSKNYFITFFNAMDNPNIPKNVAEPKAAATSYYLRYRVSADNGVSWLYDRPIIGEGFTEKNPFPGIEIGKNAIYMGDAGNKPILLNNGHILLPVQATVMADSKQKQLTRDKVYNPTGAWSYLEVLILEGKWKNNYLSWNLTARIKGDINATTRGLMEPTIIQMNNGKILTVMRGSNGGDADRGHKLPSYKWYSSSANNGKTWSKPKPWTYDNGTHFYSPSSMSVLFKHSSGRVFWLGNITTDNPKGNLPRYPIVIGEVNQGNMMLIKSSIKILDTYKKTDKGKGTLDLGHVTIIEDRATKELVITYPRMYGKQSRDWVTIRAKL